MSWRLGGPVRASTQPDAVGGSLGDAPDCKQAQLPAAARPGGRLGHYMLLHELGRGGMGVVYLAYDPRLDRRVALKILRQTDVDAMGSTRTRLLREARSLARLTHPNVVPVFDVGEAHGCAFVAMEYVDGATLGTWCRTTKPDARGIARIFADAGRGLLAAHQLGIVHRDFKPDNVLVGADGRARVVDFGIARAGEIGPPTSIDGPWSSPEASGDDLQITRAGLVLGTPAYMAPEQHRGRTPTPAADQYSFCVALFEALYGCRPFVAETLATLLTCKLAMKIEIPSHANVPRWMAQLVMRGLAPAPEARWPSLAQVVDRLDGARASRWRWWAALGAAAVASAAVLVPGPDGPECAGAGRVAAVWNPATATSIARAFETTAVRFARDTWVRASAGLDRFADQWQAEHELACSAIAAADPTSAATLDGRIQCLDSRLDDFAALLEVLHEVDAQGVSLSVAAVAALPTAVACRDAASTDRIPSTGERRKRGLEIHRKLARVHALDSAGKIPDALVAARAVLADAEALEHPPLTVEARFLYGSALERSGEYSQAREQLREALWEGLAIGSDELVASAGIDLIWLEGVSDPHLEQTDQWHRHAAAALARSPNALLEARLANNLGAMHAAAGHSSAARTEFERALAAFERLDDDGPNLNVASTLQNLGITLGDEEQLEPAREYLARALTLYEAAEGPTHPDVGDVLDALGGIALRQGKLDDAERQLEQALVIRRAALGEDHPQVGRSYNNLGGLHEAKGDYDAAQRAYGQSLAVFETALGEHALVGATLVNLGNTLERAGRLDDAATTLARALDILDRTVAADHPWVIHGQAFLGRTELRRGRPEIAAQWLARSRPLCGADITLCGTIDAASARVALLTGAGDARALAQQAQTALRTAGPAAARDLRELDAWIAEQHLGAAG